MSVAFGNIAKNLKINESSQPAYTKENTKTDEKKHRLPAIRNHVGSVENSRIKEGWSSQSASLVDSEREGNDAGSEALRDSGAESESLWPEPVIRLTTAISSGNTTTTTTTTTTTALTTTTTTTTTAATTTTTAATTTDNQSSAVSQVDFSSVSWKESQALLKQFLIDPERKKLTISYQDKTGMRHLEDCLSDSDLWKMASTSNKEIVVEMGMPLNEKVRNGFADLLYMMDKTGLVSGITLKGDDVLRTHPLIKHLLERNPGIKTLEISNAKSDTLCQTFKLWTEYHYAPSVKTTAGLKISQLRFAGLKITDAAVFGSMLRDIVAKMPNIKSVDFSQTLLSAEQQDVLRFQLQPLVRAVVLNF